MRDAVIVEKRKKPKINLSMLPELHGAWNDSTDFLDIKKKWMASSAAIYLWLKLPAKEREALAWRMYDADGKNKDRDRMLKDLGIKLFPSDDVPVLDGPDGKPDEQPGQTGSGRGRGKSK
jgi:hypothetical protein